MEDDEPYWLESDHVALKGNAEYHSLLATIALLEAQREIAVTDFDALLKAKEEALADPVHFVEKLQTGQDLALPRRQNIPELPRIDWERYSNESSGSNPIRRHGTRQQKQTGSEPTSTKSSRSNTPTSFSTTTNPYTNAADDSGGDSASGVVRGKRRDTTKSATFNKLWTLEEQTRLEELLVKYPAEEVEARRWEKIAQELGNRTRQQVQSRVQKYFIRLAREGMPVPGRIPNNLPANRRRHGNQRNIFFSQSTFCASYKPPVYMSDDDDSNAGVYAPHADGAQLPSTSQQAAQISDEEDVPEELRDTEEYAEILRLKRMRKQQQHTGPQRHIGYQCDRCGVDPIVGTRFHCQDCPPDVSTDFCQQCCEIPYETEHHKSWHDLAEAGPDTSDSHLDQDYQHSQFASGDYNYLDPNYMPAT